MCMCAYIIVCMYIYISIELCKLCLCVHAYLCLLVSFSILSWVCLCGPLPSLSFLPSTAVFSLSDDVIRWAAKSPVVQIYPKGILTPCYHSTCRAAAIASSLHDILLPRRRQKNRVQRQGTWRERGKQCLVCERGRGEGSGFKLPFMRYTFSLHTVAWRDFEAWLSSPSSVCLPVHCLCSYSLPNWPPSFLIFLCLFCSFYPWSDCLLNFWHLWKFTRQGVSFLPLPIFFLKFHM